VKQETDPAAVAKSQLRHLIDEHLKASLARGLSAQTIAYRRVYLQRVASWLRRRRVIDPGAVTPRLLEEYIARRERACCARSTLATEISVIRSFFRWLTERSELLFDPARELRVGRRSSRLPRTILTEAEVAALLASPGDGLLGARDSAILETLYSTGLRRAELCNLDVWDVDLVGGVVLVRSGKGRKDRYVPIGRCAIRAIRGYRADARTRLVVNARQSALYLATFTGRRISVKTLNYLVPRRAQAAEIEKRVTPHVLRHTCATHLLRGGADIRHVQVILGHASVSTTQIYTRVDIEDLVRAHHRAHPRPRLRLP